MKNIAISRTIHHSPECLRTSAYTNSTPFGVKPTEAKSGCPANIKPTLGFLERLQIGHQVRYVLRGLVLKEPLGHERLARNSFLLDRVGIDP